MEKIDLSTDPSKFSKKLLHPKFFVTWIAMFFWWLLTQLLPFRVQVFLGRQLGNLFYFLNIQRVKVARRNLELCFHDSSKREKERLLRKNLQSTCVGIFESGAAWFFPRYRLKNKYRVEGLEYLQQAKQNGKGVVFMGIHFTPIEIGAAFVNLECPINGFYRPHTNAVYEYIQAHGRVRHNEKSKVIPNEHIRKIVKSLRDGEVVNYAPDQDYGPRRSVFVPFFNVTAATVKAPAQLAKAGRAEIIPWTTIREAQNRYVITIYPPITDKMNDDEENNALVLNHFIEDRIMEKPEQYLWVHRRFKTRPQKSDPSLYK